MLETALSWVACGKENVEKYMTQIEGVSDSLELFLKKYAEMYGGA